ncbi:MAG: PhnD/SsuA/transferrin family substrate-binding protein [Anaerolineaceae bacterium]|nr:PhnD/SsuA/transferrin family substrate-binding protein [Anaerolineaceae bacterium]
MKRSNRNKSFLPLMTVFFLCVGLIFSACTAKTSEPTPTEAQAVLQTEVPILTATPRPTLTPTLPPMGMPGNPIKIGYVLSEEDPESINAAEDIALLISEDTGYAIENVIYSDFAGLAEAIQAGEVHLFWPKPLEYLYLNEQGLADPLLMTNHLGVFAYGVQFMTNETHGFTSYYDEETGYILGNVVDALQQFAGTRPCLLNPDSLPGYYVPMGLLAQASAPILEPVFAYDYSAIVRALYIDGICDFGIGYALVGDPRIAGDILQDIPEAQDTVQVIWQTEGVIPNIGLAASPTLPLNVQVRLQEAFLDLADTPDRLTLVSTALNFDVEAFKTIADSFYNPLRGILAPLELDLQSITQPTQNLQ